MLVMMESGLVGKCPGPADDAGEQPREVVKEEQSDSNPMDTDVDTESETISRERLTVRRKIADDCEVDIRQFYAKHDFNKLKDVPTLLKKYQ